MVTERSGQKSAERVKLGLLIELLVEHDLLVQDLPVELLVARQDVHSRVRTWPLIASSSRGAFLEFRMNEDQSKTFFLFFSMSPSLAVSSSVISRLSLSATSTFFPPETQDFVISATVQPSMWAPAPKNVRLSIRGDGNDGSN
jgi:hypothetical protein